MSYGHFSPRIHIRKDADTVIDICSTCGKIYDISPFTNMLCNGALRYSSISIYGDTYNLCPKCTSKLYNFIESISKF